MATWTDAARHELEAALATLRESLADSGGDPDEIVDDLRRHAEAEVEARGLTIVSERDVRDILGAVGAGGERAGAGSPNPGAPNPAGRTEVPMPPSLVAAAAAAEPTGPPYLGPWQTALLWLFAVVLPAVALGIELSTHICAETIFDPLPTPLHVALVALVPLANLAALLALGRGASDRSWRLLAFANGLALGVAFYYALVFLPLVPISVVFIIAYGLGLLSLSPLISLVCGWLLRRRLRARLEAPGHATAWGLLASLLVLLLVGVPHALTRYELVRAAEGTPEQRTRALAVLRAIGERDLMLRACYERSGEVGDLVSWIVGSRQVDPAQAREVYFRVTGDPFNSVPPPELLTGADRLPMDGGWDSDRGSAAVGGVRKGLSLASSRIDGSLDAAAALGYLEWTLELANHGQGVSEARAVVALPPGATVTRATLWVDGEEREAAFGGRATVRAAYEKVVTARRDPLLVTTAGPDRVLVQCFPVPAGGSMKIRIGITVPLVVEAADRARLLLPHFVERNFALPRDLHHALWVEADDPLTAFDGAPIATTAATLVAERGAAAATVRGRLEDGELATRGIVAHRDPTTGASWALDPQEAGFEVVGTLQPAPPGAAGRVVVVVDGSRGLAVESEALRGALGAARPPGTTAAPPVVLFAGDAVAEVDVARLTMDRFQGGTDNVPALVEAWDRAAASPDGIVIWVHAPQPLALSGVAELAQRCERRPDGPRIVALASVPGPNHVLDGLDGCSFITVAARRGTLAEDLRALLAGASPTGAALVPRWERVAANAGRDPSLRTSDHLVRLWARQEADRLALESGKTAAATELALRYRLVTQRTGAVVLETAQQFAEAGLEPGKAGEVPTIPEPATVLLLVVAALVLAAVAVARRKRWRAAATS